MPGIKPTLLKGNLFALNFRLQLYLKTITGTALLCITLYLLPVFFGVIEKRRGVILNDWLLKHISPYNVSPIIFFIIWGMGILMLIRAIQNPVLIPKYIWVYLLICISRMASIALVPLSPPPGMILLKDPLTGLFYGHNIITKDLFYSGHTATLFLIFLCLQKKADKIIALSATIIVACLLLIQHVHYTIDVIAAPGIVYILYLGTSRLFSNKI